MFSPNIPKMNDLQVSIQFKLSILFPWTAFASSEDYYLTLHLKQIIQTPGFIE